MAARSGGIRLRELVEEALQFICCDADAAVLDTETQRGSVFTDRVGFDTDEDMTLIREFDGIAGQIRQYLTDAPHVTNHMARHIRGIAHNDIDIMLPGGLHGDHACHRFDRFKKIKGYRSNRQFTSLDF